MYNGESRSLGNRISYAMRTELLLKHVARMQHSGIREWHGFELPELRCAPSGLHSLDSPKAVDNDLTAGSCA